MPLQGTPPVPFSWMSRSSHHRDNLWFICIVGWTIDASIVLHTQPRASLPVGARWHPGLEHWLPLALAPCMPATRPPDAPTSLSPHPSIPLASPHLVCGQSRLQAVRFVCVAAVV